MNRIPVVMCIDVEPDQRQLAPNPHEAWNGFEKTYEYFSELRHHLQAATGHPVHFSWFLRMDPQVAHAYGTAGWVVSRYSQIIEQLKSVGDAIGLHVHAWRWDESSESWVADLGNQIWVDRCVRVAFESFRQTVKQPCLYFRFGDHWMNNATLALIEKLGARFDLTVEPKTTGAQLHEPFTGAFPNCSEVPQRPYRPAKSEFRRSASLLRRRLWVIPLSTGSTDWSPQSTRAHAIATPDDGTWPASSQLNDGEGAFEGCLERVDSQLISGWAYDKYRPDIALEVEVWDGDTLLTSATAATYRPDLFAAGKGNGSHCFNIVVPSCLKDGRPHSIRANVAGTLFNLNNSPLELICREESDVDEYMTLNLSSRPWPICRIIDRLLADSTNPYLAMVVRTDVINHPDLYSHLRQSFDYVLSHRLVGQLAFETPSKMIKRL